MFIPFDSLVKPRAEAAKAKRHERQTKWAGLRPQSAQIYVENRCNLRCDHCYESEESHPGEPEQLSLSDYRRILGELANLGVLKVTFTGGEVFLRRDFLDIVAEARRLRFAVDIYTSGYFIDEKKADRLAAMQPSSVHISIYSHLAETHDGFTGIPGSWQRSVNALRLLGARGTPTVLKANLMTFNIDHLDGMIDLAGEVGADYTFDPTVKPKMDGDRSPLKYALSPDQIRRHILNRPDLYRAFQVNAPEQYCTGERSLVGNEEAMCTAATSVLSIGASGEVSPCGFFPVSAGSLKTQSLKSIWVESDVMNSVRDTRFSDMTSCGSCNVRNSCVPCMAYGQVEHDDHRGCSTSSRQLAEAADLQAKRRVRANAKMSSGYALPQMGDLSAERPSLKNGRLPLTTE